MANQSIGQWRKYESRNINVAVAMACINVLTVISMCGVRNSEEASICEIIINNESSSIGMAGLAGWLANGQLWPMWPQLANLNV